RIGGDGRGRTRRRDPAGDLRRTQGGRKVVVNALNLHGEEVPEPGEDRTDPSTRLEGWRRFVEEDPAVFDLLPEQQWQALSPPMRDAYDEARIAYHSELQVVRTSTVKDIAHQGRLLTLLNQR